MGFTSFGRFFLFRRRHKPTFDPLPQEASQFPGFRRFYATGSIISLRPISSLFTKHPTDKRCFSSNIHHRVIPATTGEIAFYDSRQPNRKRTPGTNPQTPKTTDTGSVCLPLLHRLHRACLRADIATVTAVFPDQSDPDTAAPCGRKPGKNMSERSRKNHFPAARRKFFQHGKKCAAVKMKAVTGERMLGRNICACEHTARKQPLRVIQDMSERHSAICRYKCRLFYFGTAQKTGHGRRKPFAIYGKDKQRSLPFAVCFRPDGNHLPPPTKRHNRRRLLRYGRRPKSNRRQSSSTPAPSRIRAHSGISSNVKPRQCSIS